MQWIQHQGKQSIHALKLGLEAAAILLFIMTSPGMDRSVVNEDAIEASIVLFRNNLSKNILPATNQVGHIVAGGKLTTNTTPTASKKRRRSSADVGTGLSGNELTIAKYMKKLYPSILTTVGPTVLVMERLDALVQKIPLDDQELLLIASGALASLELDPSVAVLQLVHQMHVAATGLVTSIFRLYDRLRQIIMEDLFPLMPKMPTSKRSVRTFSIRGSSVLYPSGLLTLAQSMVPANSEPQYIQTISVLIMSLVQSAVLRPTHTNGEDDDESSGQLQSGLRHCQAISDLFVQHLLQRCAKKGEDGGASEFRPLLSNLMDDLLLVVLVPEYPAAEMILLSIANHISRDLMQATRSTSKASTSETTYLNTIFDAFGRICAAEARIIKFARDQPVHRNHPIRTPNEQHVECYCTQTAFSNKLMLNCDRCYTWYHGDCVGLKRASVPEEWYCDACQLQRIVELEKDRNTNLGAMGCAVALIDETFCMQRLLIDYLSIVSRKTGERGIQDAYGFQLARWIVELNASPTAAESNHAPQMNAKTPNMSALITRLTELWDPNESSDLNDANMIGKKSLSGMLHCLSDEGRSRMVVHLISKQSVLLMSFRRQIDMIVKFMANDTSALLRKLSLKAIERVRFAYGVRCRVQHNLCSKWIVFISYRLQIRTSS
jgi:cohesin loading factor subunit SCC2